MVRALPPPTFDSSGASGPAVRMRLRAGTDDPRIRVFVKLSPTCLGRAGKSFRIDARQGDAGRFADPGISVLLRRLLERGDGILG